MSARSVPPPLAEAADPPGVGEIEVSLFGPGVGECVVVHLGAGDWVVVDSCLDPVSKRPVALEYFDRLGVSRNDQVKLVVASHWHDDHVRGLSTVVREIPSATFVCSAALRSSEFYSLVAASDFSAVLGSDVEEMTAILKELRSRGLGRVEGRGPHWALDSARLYYRPARVGTSEAQIFALSPSAASMTLAQAELAKLLPEKGAPKRRVVSQTANEVAVALLVEVGDFRVLLGSDLETRADPTLGWTAVLASTTRPTDRARAFKVAHHGSETGHEPRVWDEMLTAAPVALVTPFSRQGLPTDSDIGRLLALTPEAFLSAPSRPQKTKRSPAVERTIASVTTRFSRRESKMGQIRMRWKTDDAAPRVSLFGAAHKLERDT